MFTGIRTGIPNTLVKAGGLRAAVIAALGDDLQTAQFSDLNTLFTTSTGETQATLDGPVGKRDDLSGKDNHATQPTAGDRPTVDARVNLLERTEDFGSSTWIGGIDFVLSSVDAVYGEAWRHENNGSAGFRSRPQDVGTLSGSNETVFFLVENESASTTTVGIRDQTASAWVHRVDFNWSTKAGSTTAGSGSFAITNKGIGPNGGELYQIAVTGSGTSGNSRRAFIYPTGIIQNTDAVVIHAAQLEPGAQATRYQRVTTATDYDSVGFPRKISYSGDEELVTTFPESLGSNVTVARSIPGTGAQILTGQTVGETFMDDVNNHALIIVDRALTGEETDQLTKLLNKEAGL